MLSSRAERRRRGVEGSIVNVLRGLTSYDDRTADPSTPALRASARDDTSSHRSEDSVEPSDAAERREDPLH
jgi:hypothetical protein